MKDTFHVTSPVFTCQVVTYRLLYKRVPEGGAGIAHQLSASGKVCKFAEAELSGFTDIIEIKLNLTI